MARGRKRKPERPRTQTLTLSNGDQITVGRISWDGLKSIRQTAIDLLSSGVAEQLSALISGPVVERLTLLFTGQKDESGKVPEWTDTETSELLQAAIAQLKHELPTLASSIVMRADGFTDDFARYCIKGDINDSDWDAYDWIDIRDAAMELNDIPELVGREKNFYLGLFETAAATLGLSSSETTPNGTSHGKASSPAPTAGAPETSAR